MVNHDEFDVDYEVESEKHGITGTVTPYAFTNMSYPYIYVEDITAGATKAKLHALKGLIVPTATREVIDKTIRDAATIRHEKRYHIYTKIDGSLFELGTINESRFSAVIDTLGIATITEVALEPGKTLQGNLIYSLVPVGF